MYCSKYLAEITPRKVKVMKSDGSGEFLEGAIGARCTTDKIKQEFTPADSSNTTVLLNAKSQS